ncbi:MAG: SDR family NAD(P)-dependent oxidoreductase [Pseudomonadales bacterium]|nr:SDR family NAD(P)-dependent oxidoreductase [Pseudomonadales bacterium]
MIKENEKAENEKSKSKKKYSRRVLLRNGSVLAAAGIGATIHADDDDHEILSCELNLSPRYYPLNDFSPEIDLAGKFAVVTGASRGIGRATAEALTAQGATVIGTSRNVSNVPNPSPDFDLLDLDVTSGVSVNGFVDALLNHPSYPGQIDILINNAGRYIIGTLVPPPIAPNPAQFYTEQTALGMETNYNGQIRVTNALLPHMAMQGYARIGFTVSSAGYLTGGTEFGEINAGLSFFATYSASKRALLAYANNLRIFLNLSGSNIQVSTINPFLINTGLVDGTNPVFTEPVDANGNAPSNPILQQGLDLYRFAFQTAIPASVVGDSYVQLLTSAQPAENVIVGSPDEPLATQGGTELVNSILMQEHDQAAVQFAASPVLENDDDDGEDDDDDD